MDGKLVIVRTNKSKLVIPPLMEELNGKMGLAFLKSSSPCYGIRFVKPNNTWDSEWNWDKAALEEIDIDSLTEDQIINIVKFRLSGG